MGSLLNNWARNGKVLMASDSETGVSRRGHLSVRLSRIDDWAASWSEGRRKDAKVSENLQSSGRSSFLLLHSMCSTSFNPCISFISDLEVIVLKPEAFFILPQANWTSICNSRVIVDLDMYDAPPERKDSLMVYGRNSESQMILKVCNAPF